MYLRRSLGYLITETNYKKKNTGTQTSDDDEHGGGVAR